MMMDAEIRLNGEAAVEFHNMMTSVDIESLNARDKFLSDLTCELDEQGVLSIDISDLDVDLSVMQDMSCEIEAVPVSKNETYVGEISVQFTASPGSNINISNERNTSYTVTKYYASTGMYSVDQSVSISYAA